MSPLEVVDDLAMGAQTDAQAALSIDAVPVPAALLDGGEIVEFSIRPSLWFVLFASAKTLVGLAAVALGVWLVVASSPGWSLRSAYAFSFLLLAAVVRVLIGSLQWASRMYMLTNRRVMRVSGILEVSVTDCPLSRISAAHIRVSPGQMLLGLGTIRMTPPDSRLPTVNWEHVARPAMIHEKIVRAIQRSRSGDAS